MTTSTRLARISRRTAWLAVLGWVVLIGVLTAVAPTLDSVKADGNGNPPDSSMSMRASELSRAEFGDPGAPPAIVVVRSDSAAGAGEAVAAVAGAIEDAGIPSVAGVRSAERDPSGSLVSGDGGTQMVVVSFQGNPGDDGFRDDVGEVREVAADAAGDAEVAVTGPAGIVVDAVKVFSGSDKVLLLGTIALVVVLLFLIYRSPVLVLVSLLGVGFAMRLAEGAGALLADAGLVTIDGQTASIMTVLLFGVGTDYALIIFARFREALIAYDDPQVAMAVAMRSVAGALLASVSTIVAAVLALLFAVTPTLRDFGPYLAIGVASMALVAFTLTPALLVLCGRVTFWPRRAGVAREPRVWSRVADLVTAFPRRVLALGIAALLAMSAGLIGVQQSFDLVSGFRIDTESARGQQVLAEEFGPGTIAPSTVLVRSSSRVAPAVVAELATAVSEADGVASVGRVQPSEDGRTLSADVVLNVDPYSPNAMELVPALVGSVEDAAADAGIGAPEVLIGGETSIARDTRSALDRDLVVVGLLMLLAVALVLAVVLRSLLAPLYLAATLLLSYAATMGAMTFLALGVGGDEGIGNRVSVYVLVFLVALGVDYTIFMMTRYRQELASRDSVSALRTSIVRTGGVISSAGVILAGTFAVLMTQPIRELFQFGLAMAIGILLDTFVVRPLLVPAIIRLTGRRALWPTRVTAECGADTRTQWRSV